MVGNARGAPSTGKKQLKQSLSSDFTYAGVLLVANLYEYVQNGSAITGKTVSWAKLRCWVSVPPSQVYDVGTAFPSASSAHGAWRTP
ncbi:hypothetical protein OB08_11345 [Microbacterium sp. HJ5]